MKKRQEGAAMIVVMCVMVMIIALSLALLLSASVLITNANRAARKEQCRVTAVAVAKLLEKEIVEFNYQGYPGDDKKENHPGESVSDLKYILGSCYTDAWRSYDKTKTSSLEGKKSNNIIRYELEDGRLPGDTLVELYWTDEGEEEAELDRNQPTAASDIFREIHLYVRVTNTVGEESATIISSFQPDQIRPDETAKTWTSWKWKYVGHEWEGSMSG